MTAFYVPADIGNRALQHCGAPRMDPLLGFGDTSSRGAAEISFCYDKLREAELQRRIWTFATRRQVIRAIDTNTARLTPSLWTSLTSYFVGSIVADQNNNLWISRVGNNLGNNPLLTSVWEPYFGPLSVSLYDSTVSYFSGEVVYTIGGDGTYNVYLSLLDGNSVHPALPNQWASATTFYKNQVVQSFPAWSSLTTYTAGQTVTYTDGNTYSSLVGSNLNNIPTSTTGTKWALVPTLVLTSQQVPVSTVNLPPLSSPVIEWAIGTTYSIGSFVMFKGTEYVSIANNNTGQFPNASGSTFWAALSLGTLYMSLINFNYGNTPANAPALWSSSTTYATGNQVGGSDGTIYSSLVNGNLNHNPVTDTGTNWQNTGVINPWTTVFTQGGGNDQWMQIGGASFPNGVGLAKFNIVYPRGAGPASQPNSKNAYRLPAGYLRRAPEDPKAGTVSWLGGPSGYVFEDWLIEGDFLISAETGPIPLRFIANVTDVTKMHTMFCEGLAARVGLEICEAVTQSDAKLGTIAKIYDKWITEAGIQNAIENGFTQSPDDDLISCRL